MSLKIKSLLLTTTPEKIYEVPAGIEASVHGLVFSNNSASSITFSLVYYKNSTNTSFQLAEDFTILPRKSYTWPRPINMAAGDYLEALASTNDAVTVAASYYENDKQIAKGFTVRGIWDENNSYEINDVVLFQGETYVALEESSGISPEDTTKWILFIPKGEKGDQGPQGIESLDSAAVKNVIYVSKSGDDLNDGSTLQLSKLTLRSALQAAKGGTTIFVKSGDYVENNPLTVPANVAVWGDSLRTVTIRPKNKTRDLFWVNNGSYLSQMTFKDYEAPSAAVCFPPDGSAGSIFTSPYVQNCTSITTTGTGMRVDGNHVEGLKSMVVDAYTQYNQGGIGIHMLNRGNTQLVSVFTICCDIGFLCESGGFCSVTNSNSSFGNFALKADGVSTPLYAGKTKGTNSGTTFIIDNLLVRPNVGDAVKFESLPDFYTVASSTEFTRGDVEIVLPAVSAQPSDRRNARSLLLDAKNKIQIDTIDYINRVYPTLNYNQFKATRDTGLVIDAVADDVVFQTNYNSLLAAFAYTRASAQNLVFTIRNETVDSLDFAKKESLKIISQNYSKNSQIYKEIERGFDLIIDTVLNGTGDRLQELVEQIQGSAGSENAAASAATLVDLLIDIVINNETHPSRVLPDYSWVSQDLQQSFTLLQSNRDILKTQVTQWIADNFPEFEYDVRLCERDVRIIVESVGYDMLFGTNFKSIIAGISYYRSQTALVIQDQLVQTIGAFTYLKSKMLEIVEGVEDAETRVAANMDIILDILENGLGSVPAYDLSSAPTGIDQGLINAINLLTLNREFIQKEVIEYIDITNPPFEYNKEKCGRDSEIILNGIYYDLALGTNYKSQINGQSYLRSMTSVVITDQLDQTVGALRYLKLEVQNRLENQSFLVKRNFALFEEIIEIIETSEVQEIQWSDPGINANLRFARQQLQNNKELAKTELVSWISSNYPTFEYDQTLCERDILFLVDAVSYDIQYGGNSAVIEVARSYFDNVASVLPQGEKAITVAAYRQLASILSDIVIEQYQGQDTTSSPASQAEADAVELLVEIVATVVEDDSLVNLPEIEFPNLSWVEREIRTNLEDILTDKTEIVEETLSYIDHTYGFVYDRAVCERDVGYIIDSLLYDLTYGGNSETISAANSYYSKNQLQIPEKERLATAAAYRYLKSLVRLVSLSTKIGSLPELFLDESVSSNALKAVTLINDNREFIKAQMVKFIETNFQTFSYNEELCSRDAGLIIDALSYDMVFDSNFKTIIAALSYYRVQALEVINQQKLPTIRALEYLKTLVLDVVKDNSVAVQRITDNFDLLLDILENGLEQVPVYRIPDPDNYNVNLSNARNSIKINYEFIQEEAIAYITANYPSLNYDSSVCKRDIRYVLDAVVYDITYGGNSESIHAARSYYSNAILQIPSGELGPTIATFDFIRVLLSDIVLSNTVSPLQTNVIQNFGVAATSAESAVVNQLMSNIITLLDDINADVQTINPNITWTPQLLQNQFQNLQTEKNLIRPQVINWINERFLNFTYNQEICKRDLDLILNAVIFDLRYDGNSRTADAADEYYSGGVLQIPGETFQTIEAFRYVNQITQLIVLSDTVAELQQDVDQIFSNDPATETEANKVRDLLEIVANIIENAYSSVVTFEENVPLVGDNTTVTFHQYSLITSSGHTFEWIGAGTNVNTALPYLGGTPLTENQVIEINGGKVYFTGTDQRGDFRIGSDFVINQNTGTISGRTFTRSLFAVMTPYILAIGD